jgi:type II restriction/modification system DNA methylase subunit YeeA
MGRWPHYDARQYQRKRSISYILNQSSNANPKRVDYRTLAVLSEAFLDCTKPSKGFKDAMKE